MLVNNSSHWERNEDSISGWLRNNFHTGRSGWLVTKTEKQNSDGIASELFLVGFLGCSFLFLFHRFVTFVSPLHLSVYSVVVNPHIFHPRLEAGRLQILP